MKPACIFIAIFFILITLSCKKETTFTITDLQGTWNYSGYSGGFAGMKFTPVNSEGPYIQIKDSSFFITYGEGYAQKCMHFTFLKDSSGTSNFLTGILTVSDTSFMLPAPDQTKYFLYLRQNNFSLYPYNSADAFEIYYAPSIKRFTPCN